MGKTPWKSISFFMLPRKISFGLEWAAATEWSLQPLKHSKAQQVGSCLWGTVGGGVGGWRSIAQKQSGLLLSPPPPCPPLHWCFAAHLQTAPPSCSSSCQGQMCSHLGVVWTPRLMTNAEERLDDAASQWLFSLPFYIVQFTQPIELHTALSPIRSIKLGWPWEGLFSLAWQRGPASRRGFFPTPCPRMFGGLCILQLRI